MTLARRFAPPAPRPTGRGLRLLLPLLLLGLAFPADASRTRPLNLEELAARADRVFQGRCTALRVEVDPALGQLVTHATFVPTRFGKGEAVHGKVTLKLLGNQTPSARPGEETAGVPRFAEGEEVVLFLYPESGRGLTSPVGFGQGKFTIARDRGGSATAANLVGNQNLLERLSPEARQRLGERANRWRGARAIPPDELLSMVRELGQ